MLSVFFFFFNDTATTEIYTLSLHDALPIYLRLESVEKPGQQTNRDEREGQTDGEADQRQLQTAYAESEQDVVGSRAQRHARSEEHTSELQSQSNLVCRLLLEKKNIVSLTAC